MGNKSVKFASYEDMQKAITTPSFYIINTMPKTLQTYLIKGTMDISLEENTINALISQKSFHCYIIIYGKNSSDKTVHTRYNQLLGYGFVNVHIYSGGLFEWLLLCDIYGEELFPLTAYDNNNIANVDVIKYKSDNSLMM